MYLNDISPQQKCSSLTDSHLLQVAQLSQRDSVGGLVMDESGTLELRYNIYGHYKSFKVIEVGTNRKPVCD